MIKPEKQQEGKERHPKMKQNKPVATPPAQDNPAEAQAIPINGFQQVLDMLRIADPAFRESLLKRLAQKDPKLAKTLRRDLAL